MKKSTVIAYLELKRKHEGMAEVKTEQIKEVNAKLNQAKEDHEFDALEADLHLYASERATYEESVEKIRGILSEERKGENGSEVRQWIREYHEGQPKSEETITYIKMSDPVAGANARLTEIYKNK